MRDLKHSQLTSKIIGAAIEVHRQLGPGLLEAAYETCLAHELSMAGLLVERQIALPIVYKGLEIEQGYRIDLLIDRQVVVELKAVERLTAVHEAQLLSYLKFSGCEVGLLINFNVKILKFGGIRRIVRTHKHSTTTKNKKSLRASQQSEIAPLSESSRSK